MIKCPESTKDVSEFAMPWRSWGFPVDKTVAAPQQEKEETEKKEMLGAGLGSLGVLWQATNRIAWTAVAWIGIGGLLLSILELIKYVFSLGNGSAEETLRRFTHYAAAGMLFLLIASVFSPHKKQQLQLQGA